MIQHIVLYNIHECLNNECLLRLLKLTKHSNYVRNLKFLVTNFLFRYVTTFNWLDKLGQSALHNYQVIIRQTFYHGCYALIDEKLEPNPDFWISALYKKLVGTKVKSVSFKSRFLLHFCPFLAIRG